MTESRTAVVTQSNYIPWKGYFDQIRAADEFVLYDDAQYTKRDWRNRNKIKTSAGLHWLSIPVQVKGKFFQKIKDTQVVDSSWAQKHWRAIHDAYARAPHYREYGDRLRELYSLAENLTFLSEINFLFIQECCEILGISSRFTWSSDYELKEDRTERLAHICAQVKADTYLSGPAAKDYMELGYFRERGIAVRYFDYRGYPEYPQLHGPFEHAVSVLDLIFHVGPEASSFLNPCAVEHDANQKLVSGDE